MYWNQVFPPPSSPETGSLVLRKVVTLWLYWDSGVKSAGNGQWWASAGSRQGGARTRKKRYRQVVEVRGMREREEGWGLWWAGCGSVAAPYMFSVGRRWLEIPPSTPQPFPSPASTPSARGCRRRQLSSCSTGATHYSGASILDRVRRSTNIHTSHLDSSFCLLPQIPLHIKLYCFSRHFINFMEFWFLQDDGVQWWTNPNRHLNAFYGFSLFRY